MHEHVTTLFQTLAKAGAVPGSDFSISPTDGSLRMNEESYRLLTRLYPEVEWDDVTAVIEPDLQTAVDSVHHHLGTDFVHQILEHIHTRLSELPQGQASWYLRQVLGGVQHRTGIELYELLIQDLDASRFVYVESLLHGDTDEDPCNVWIGDLILSAGGSMTDFVIEDEDAVLTERGLRLLATVWAGEENLYEQLS